MFLGCEILPSEWGRQQARAELAEYVGAAPGRPRHRPGRTALLALSVAAAIAVVAFLFVVPFSHRQSDVKWIREYTSLDEKKHIVLPDSSEIWLNRGSEIFYPDRFAGRQRKVFVSGEVYACISKDSRHPFVMDAEGMEIAVHGTKFNVKAYRSSDSREVFLEEGGISLQTSENGGTVDMQPNELVRYSVSQDMLEKYTISPDSYPDWRTPGALSFVNMKFVDIISELERFYGREIIVADDVSGDTRFYASFINGEDIFRVLDALNTDRRMKISEIENCILITTNK